MLRFRWCLSVLCAEVALALPFGGRIALWLWGLGGHAYAHASFAEFVEFQRSFQEPRK